MTVDTLLGRLDSVKQTGTDKWVARCPAHQDKSPSLSVRDTGTRTLIYCYAGCEAEDILAAVGLGWRDLYRNEWKAAREAAIHQRTKLPRVDPLALERRIIELGHADLKTGKSLSLEDRTRLEIALQRVKEAG